VVFFGGEGRWGWGGGCCEGTGAGAAERTGVVAEGWVFAAVAEERGWFCWMMGGDRGVWVLRGGRGGERAGGDGA